MPEKENWEADVDWIGAKSNCNLDKADDFAHAVAARMGEDKALSDEGARQLVKVQMNL